jgi:hypothetical protein
MVLERASHTSDDVYEAALAKRWRELGCAAEGAPYVIGGLLRQLEFEGPFAEESPQKHILARAFLDEEHCAGAHGLTEDEKARLRQMRDRALPKHSR